VADTVDITAGTGTTIATDDAGAGGHVQIVKLALSADGSASPITADANGLEIQGAGTAGTPAGGVVSVQGVGSGTALAVSLATLPALVAGTANIGDVDVLSLPAIPAGTNNIGDVDVLTLPATAGVAASTMNATSGDGSTALTNSAQAIKGAAGVLYGYYLFNPNSTTAYVVFYNTASGSVTVGTTNPLFVIAVPPTAAANLWMQPGGITFGTAMSWAATSTAAGNGAPATALDCVAWYA
jgi:hypothetical protein